MASPKNTDAADLFVWLLGLMGDFVEEHELGQVFARRLSLGRTARTGVPEYWIVDEMEQRITLLRRTASGAYREAKPRKGSPSSPNPRRTPNTSRAILPPSSCVSCCPSFWSTQVRINTRPPVFWVSLGKPCAGSSAS
jgi:hypothetical protein